MSQAMNRRVWARPQGLEIGSRQELWVPPHVAEGRKGWEICPEPDVNTHKMFAFKYRLSSEHHWIGQLIHSPMGEDLDVKGADGLSARDQLHRLLTGLVERLTGDFVFQDSDEMQGRTWIDQWAEKDHGEERWNQFVRYVPPKRDSPQVLDNL